MDVEDKALFTSNNFKTFGRVLSPIKLAILELISFKNTF